MVKSYSGTNKFAKINKKHYNTPKLLPDDPIYHGSLFDVLVKPDKKYVENGNYKKQYKLNKLNNITLPKSAYCYTNRFFVEREKKCKFELPIENVEVNSKLF